MKKFTFFISFLFCVACANAQTRYLVRFKDKGTNPFSLATPSQYLSQRALDRRTRYSIAIDSLDLPITPRYIDSVRLAGAVTILNGSKWLNEVAIRTTDPAAIAKINSLPFVISMAAVASFSSGQTTPVNKIMDGPNGLVPETSSSFTGQVLADFYNYGRSHGQVHLHQGEFLHNHGFRGENMRLSVLDGGFFRYQTLPTFDSIRINGQILDTRDFVANEASVNEDDAHGMNCLSTIAANLPGLFVGTAPKATFCLYRTEDVATEYKIEEHNLAAGFERADSIGVDVCSVSLGYNQFDIASQNYTYADMNGNTTISARAADIAALKGMLPVVAAGNDGNSAWHFIATPGDADSVLTVGAVDTLTNVAGFSSYGPSSDGQIKPTLAAVGLNAVIANSTTGNPQFGNGTSFATPNLAGLTTCLWQAFPEFNNMTILDAMQRSASRFANPNDRIGYGIPDMKKAFVILLRKSFTKSLTGVSGCKATFQLHIKEDNTMNIVIERKQLTTGTYATVKVIAGAGNFTEKDLTVVDDLFAATASPVIYRIRLDIAADTSIYLDSLTVNFVPKPALGVDKNVAVCNAAPFDLTTQFNTAGYTTVWTLNTAPVAAPQAVTASGSYQLIAASTSGCPDTALVNLNIITKLDIGPDKSITKCTTQAVDLNMQYNLSGLTVQWSIAGNAVANPNAVTPAGTYRIIATNASGCIDTAFVTVVNDQNLCPANVVYSSPNPVRDVVNVSVNRLTASKITIVLVNASGQKMYETTYQQAAGLSVKQIDMKAMAGGIYYLSVFANDEKVSTQSILKK